MRLNRRTLQVTNRKLAATTGKTENAMIRINGARLQRWREEAGQKQEGLAELLEISARTLRNAETQGWITEKLADAICKKLDKPKAELIRLTADLRVLALDGVSEDQEDLFQSALRCHARLFPDAFSEVSRKDMRQWLAESNLREHSGTPWHEIYAAVYEDSPSQRNVVGLISLSGHNDWEFWYCTRLGVLPEWRAGLAAEKALFQLVKEKTQELLPKATTFIWEVEAPDILLLDELRQHLAKGHKLKKWPDQKRMMQALRSARRLELFGWIHARIATDPSGVPLTITSPAWREPLDSSNERQTMLMLHPLGGDLSRAKPSVDRALEFIDAVLLADSFGGIATGIELKNYRPYVNELLARMKTKAKGSKWGPLPRFQDLITQAKAEGLWDEIALIEAEK